MTSIDLKEAYLHVPIRPSHRRFLRFTYSNRHFQYRAMPFGLSSAPRTFTKLLATVAAFLRLHPIRVVCYLDNILILSSTRERAVVDLHTVIRVLQQHEFSLNLDKSQLLPTNRILHLGAIIDSNSGHVFLSPDRILSIRSLVHQVLTLRSVPLLMLSQLLGKLISCIAIVPWAHLHACPLQWYLLPYQRSCRASSNARVVLPAAV